MSSEIVKSNTGLVLSHQAIHQEILEGLTKSERKIALATITSEENPKVKNMNAAQIESTLDSILLKASVRLGHKEKTGLDAEALRMELNEDLGRFVNLTRTEIYQAVDNGLNGEYKTREDEVIYLSPSNFVQWIKSYIEQTKKPVMQKVSRAAQDLKTEDVPVPTEKESIQTRFALLLKASVDYFEKGEVFHDHGGLLYDLLTKFDLLQPVDPEGDEVKKAAFHMLNEAKATRDKNKIKSITEVYSKVAAGGSDESAFERATRIAVQEKMLDVFAGGEDDTLMFLENLKERILEYFKEKGM